MSARASAFAPIVSWSALIVVAVAVVLGSPSAVDAHPLGNFTINHLTRLTVQRGTVDVRYVLDLAEIPTVAVEHTIAVGGSPSAGDAGRSV
jgi:hypothetical protein